MGARLIGGSIALSVALSWAATTACAQWTVGVEVGADRFWGGSAEAAPPHRSFRPYRPTTSGLVLEHRSRRGGVGLRLLYTKAGLALEGNDAVVAAKGVFTVYGVSPEVSYRLATLEAGNQLVLRIGPLFELWQIVDAQSRNRIGAQGSASLGIPLRHRWAGMLSAGVAVIPSPFENGELAGYALQALWRRRFAAGLRYRL